MGAIHPEAERIFTEAIGLPTSDREKHIVDACADDSVLLRQVLALLDHHQRSGMLDAPIVHVADGDPGPTSFDAPRIASIVCGDLSTPERIGGYRILDLLGSGGMGAVYRAEQESPRREVALKVIRHGLASREALRRFEHESQVLARLQHPGIAQVYEAGTFETEAGPQPYFAMELVRGELLSAHADRTKLGTRDRLDLIAKICRAVHHAHQKGVIHRDLKPANILVTPDGQPKILDFGVARATDADIHTTTVQTDIGQLIGTVPYMSPEQAAGDPDAIDTRSDVYALGVVAYELLAGRLPYDLTKKLVHEAVRVIREEEPTRLSSINRTLRGDVEIIVGRALAKEKERRYQSADDLASDIDRYLKDEPIVARPPNAAYQLGKFARRNKALVGGVAAVFIALAAGVVATGAALVREAEQRRLAETNEQRAVDETARAMAAEEEAQTRSAQLRVVAEFQSNMLAQIDPTTAGARLTADVSRRLAEALEKSGMPEGERAGIVDSFRASWARVNATDAAMALIDETILKPAVRVIDEEFQDQPEVEAQLRQTLGDRYTALGLYDAAAPLQNRALDIRRAALGDEHPDTLHSIHGMGVLHQAQGRLSDAEPHYLEALEKRRRTLGDEHPDTLTSINNIGGLYWLMGRRAEAEPYWRRSLDARMRILGDEHPDTLTSMNNIGLLLQVLGRFAEAEPYFRETLEKRRRVLGEEHPETISSIGNMGLILRAQGRLADAEPYYREVLDKSRRVLGEEHPSTLACINNLGVLLRARGRLDEAEAYYREALEKRRRVLGEEHPETLSSIGNMGLVLRAQGKLDEAEPYYHETMAKFRRVLGENHPRTLTATNYLGGLLQAQGRIVEAEPYYREALEKRRIVLGAEHPETLIGIGSMGDLLRELERPRDAIELLTPSEAAARRVFAGGNAPRLALYLRALGRAHAGAASVNEHFVLAESYLLEAHSIFLDTHGSSHGDTLECVRGLIELYNAWRTAAPGAGHDAKAADWSIILEKNTP